MAMRMATRWLTIGASIGLICSFGTAQQTTHNRPLPLISIIEALENAQVRTRPRVSYQVIREYHLSGARDSKSDSHVIAEVDFRPPTSKNYRIQKSSGSDRGQHVVRRILDNEIDSASTDNQARTALSRDNYDFAYIGEVILDGQPCYLLGLKPKRKERNLISGQVWVDQHSFLVRQLEGEVAKTPSWWLKKVSVKLGFADLDGNWLQSNVEAVADVRVFGSHTLTSHILDYRVADEVASVTSRMPSQNRKP
jgi:hypothetical protein